MDGNASLRRHTTASIIWTSTLRMEPRSSHLAVGRGDATEWGIGWRRDGSVTRPRCKRRGRRGARATSRARRVRVGKSTGEREARVLCGEGDVREGWCAAKVICLLHSLYLPYWPSFWRPCSCITHRLCNAAETSRPEIDVNFGAMACMPRWVRTCAMVWRWRCDNIEC